MSTVLVTGGAGYIGSHACKALSQAGYEPVTYDNLENGHEWAVKWGPLEQGDILDSDRLDEVMQKYKPTAVMHFAAYISVGESVADPDLYYRNNVTGSNILLDCMARQGLDKIIFSSSAAVYGEPQCIPITEDHPQNPVSPYGQNKRDVEKMLQEYASRGRIRSVALRYFNAAGADPGNETGEAHNPETHLIPLVMEAAADSTPVRVFGNDYTTPDGTCIRDYIHVTDLVDAHLLALNALNNNKSEFTAYNLGTGTGYSVMEVIKSAEKVTAKEIQVNHHARRAGDSSVLVCNADKIRNELNWKPVCTGIEPIIKSAWHWHQKKQQIIREQL